MLPRDEVIDGIDREVEGFAALVRSLDERESTQPSRCEGWTARDVAAHLIGAFADITSGRIEGRGTPEVSERQVAERHGRTDPELADECDPGSRRLGGVPVGDATQTCTPDAGRQPSTANRFGTPHRRHAVRWVLSPR